MGQYLNAAVAQVSTFDARARQFESRGFASNLNPPLASAAEVPRVRLDLDSLVEGTPVLIKQVGNYLLQGGGKRLRPLLLMISSGLCGGSGGSAARPMGSGPAAPTDGRACVRGDGSRWSRLPRGSSRSGQHDQCSLFTAEADASPRTEMMRNARK